ncbi:MAG: hypothetical protein GY758_32880 [Fuerstiella sp.]|nr:hypothetical protein [Fuerstiella sp.]MCP4783712.1 hypothetical protein [Fuerstiella sp.]MCP4857053.1 hypothetical protein [Fuerstiella sp.]
MTDQPNNAPQFSDDQMDQLLNTFYRMEVPAELDQLPSSWPAVRVQRQQSVSLAQPESRPAHRATSAGRGLAVAGAALAACLMVIVLSTTGGNLDNTETAGTKDSTSVVGESNAMMDVHKGNSGSGVVDDVNTTLDEIDGVDLAPEQKPEEESKDSSEQK